jgi:hypothetical protein
MVSSHFWQRKILFYNSLLKTAANLIKYFLG